jgi:hypothetical protein
MHSQELGEDVETLLGESRQPSPLSFKVGVVKLNTVTAFQTLK